MRLPISHIWTQDSRHADSWIKDPVRASSRAVTNGPTRSNTNTWILANNLACKAQLWSLVKMESSLGHLVSGQIWNSELALDLAPLYILYGRGEHLSEEVMIMFSLTPLPFVRPLLIIRVHT